MNDPVWTSTSRLSYRKPMERNNPTARAKSLLSHHFNSPPIYFDNNVRRNNKPKAKASGFVCNTNLHYRIKWANSRLPGGQPQPIKLVTNYRQSFQKPSKSPYLARLMVIKK